MMRGAPLLEASILTSLPDVYRHRGAPSAWARMTRPGRILHSFLEGAFFDDDRALWLSDVPHGRVFRVTPGREWELVHHYRGEPHSMRIAPGGRHIAVDYGLGLVELTGYDTFDVIGTGGGEPFLGLSDMTFAPDGSLWFTDSGRTSLSDPRGAVYRLDAEGDLRRILNCVPYSNGICLSPDGDWVYVAATRANQIWRFSPRLPEKDPPMTGVFLSLSGGLGPDGLAVNSLGWLAIAQAQAGRSYVVDQVGDGIAEIRLPDGQWTTSVAFHPDDPRLLYIVDAEDGAVFTCRIPDL